MVKVFRIKKRSDRGALRKGKAVPEMLDRSAPGSSDKRDRPEKERPSAPERPRRPSRGKADVTHLDERRFTRSTEAQLRGQRIRAPQYLRRESVRERS